LRLTGKTPSCVSRWGADRIYDMVGNLDEWVDDEAGLFLGGFYARSTREGCESRVSSHAPIYYDYSTGARCCRALTP
jgi:formylglycine-generating enzyme required for sulfatase activity